MPKPKLSDAVTKPKATATETSTATGSQQSDAAPQAAGGDNSDAGDAESGADDPDDSGDDADDPDDNAGAGAGAPDDGGSPSGEGAAAEPSANTLADYRAAFGHEQGSVYFADQTSFADACVAHLGKQAETIAAQAKQIAELTQQNKELAQQVMGESNPVLTDAGAATTGNADTVSSFAEAQRKKLSKSSAA